MAEVQGEDMSGTAQRCAAGWIKIHRQILSNPHWKDVGWLHVWMYLLLNATHKEMDVVFAGKRITLKPGQLVTSRRSIAVNSDLNESRVQRILCTMKTERQIEQVTTSVSRLITILNWCEYQQNEQPIEQQLNNERTTNEQRMNTNKNIKNEENGKNGEEEPPEISFAKTFMGCHPECAGLDEATVVNVIRSYPKADPAEAINLFAQDWAHRSFTAYVTPVKELRRYLSRGELSGFAKKNGAPPARRERIMGWM